MAIKGNKGEWSEFYAFIKILTDGELFAADENLEVLREKFFTVLKIIREEKDGKKSYDISKGNGETEITDGKGNTLGTVELSKIKNRVSEIFSEMKRGSSATFEISLAEQTMRDLRCSQIKASSGRKADLSVVVHDRIAPTFPELGFSIKSMLGSPSTLLNASRATNFVFEIKNFPKEEVGHANGASGNSKLRDKAKEIYTTGADLEFESMDSEGFRRNLRKIDSNLPEIIAEILKYYYNGKGVRLPELVDRLSENRELSEKLDLNKSDYEYKIKNFLSAVALGMTPKKEWDGFAKAHGGYIIVKENGEVVCYHLYNRDEFEEYLYRNTKLDTPSTTRHSFGEIYEEGGKTKIKYNLQIRFTK